MARKGNPNWVPGVSGNPSGTQKGLAEVREAAKLHTQEAIDRLAFWMKSKNPKASVSACVALLDRGWGKPAQAMEVSGKDGGDIIFKVTNYANADA